MLTFAHHDLAVDYHEVDSLGILVRLGVGRRVANRARIENDDVGGEALAEDAAIGDPHSGGWTRGDAPDPLFERVEALIAHVAPEESREGAVTPRVWPAAAQGAIRRERQPIRDHQREGVLEEPAHVLLALRVDHHVHLEVVIHQETQERLLGRGTHHPGDFRHLLALEATVHLASDGGDQHPLPLVRRRAEAAVVA